MYGETLTAFLISTPPQRVYPRVYGETIMFLPGDPRVYGETVCR